MELSVIIPYHNEGREFILETINSVKDTIDVSDYEIIVVDDCSDEPLEEIENIRIFRHNINKGVGAAFDTGALMANSKNLFIMGSDIRFLKNKWASQMIKEINEHPKSFTCTSCVAISKQNMNIEERRLVNVVNGATILMFHDKKSDPNKSENFKSIIEARWLPRLKNRDIDSVEIPCILGAAYGVSKSWYNYVDGWAGHKTWGSLEPYISLKTWLFGGSCRIATRIETAHIFKTQGTHNVPQHVLFYNKMMIATLLLDDYDRFIDFLGDHRTIKKAKEIYNDNIDFIMKKKEEYKDKIVYKPEDFFKKFKIDYRNETTNL